VEKSLLASSYPSAFGIYLFVSTERIFVKFGFGDFVTEIRQEGPHLVEVAQKILVTLH
jgi:hypothetical protein